MLGKTEILDHLKTEGFLLKGITEQDLIDFAESSSYEVTRTENNGYKTISLIDGLILRYLVHVIDGELYVDKTNARVVQELIRGIAEMAPQPTIEYSDTRTFSDETFALFVDKIVESFEEKGGIILLNQLSLDEEMGGLYKDQTGMEISIYRSNEEGVLYYIISVRQGEGKALLRPIKVVQSL